MEADGAVDAQNAPTAPWKTLCVFHELPQGLSHQVTHEKLRKAPKYRWETRIDPYFSHYNSANGGQAGLLDFVKRTLRKTYTRTPDIGRNGQAVTIRFDDFVLDVVPGFVRQDGGFLIPNSITQQWLSTDPKRHVEIMAEANRLQPVTCDEQACRAPACSTILPRRRMIRRSRFQLWCWEPIHRRHGALYLDRLRVVSCPWFGLYVHWFQTSDDDCLHDHPWPFLTVILRGGYWEDTPGPSLDRATVSRWHGPGSVRVRPARWLHRIAIDPAHKPVTLVLRGPVGRAWGFKTRAGWIPWRAYTQRPPP